MKWNFQVRTMHCSACANAVTRCVEKLDGANSVYVNFAAGTLSLEADPEKLSKEKLKEKVRAIGFELLDQEEATETLLLKEEEEEKKENRSRFRSLVAALGCASFLFYVSMHKMLYLPFFPASPSAEVLLQIVLLAGIFAAGRSFFITGFKGLSRGNPNMDTLVALCSTASVVYSVYALLRTGPDSRLCFDSAGMVISLVMLGKYLERSTRN